MSNDTLDENDGTANVVVRVDKPLPASTTLNVSAASTSTATAGMHYTVPSTLTIQGGSDTGTLTLAGIDNQTEQQSALTIDLEISGTLPDGRSFDASDPLIHQVTIIDDERPTVGWVDTASDLTAPPSGSNIMHMIMVRMSQTPSSPVRFSTQVTGGVEGIVGGDFAFPANGCDAIQFRTTDTGANLTKSCEIIIFPSAAGKTLTMTLVDNLGQLANQGFTIDPTTHVVTVSAP